MSFEYLLSRLSSMEVIRSGPDYWEQAIYPPSFRRMSQILTQTRMCGKVKKV